jgi:hypothetical protein
MLGKNGAGKTNALCGVIDALLRAIRTDWETVHSTIDVFRGPSGESFVAHPDAAKMEGPVVVLQPHLHTSQGHALLAAMLSVGVESSDTEAAELEDLRYLFGSELGTAQAIGFVQWCASQSLVAVREGQVSPAALPEQIDVTALDMASEVLRLPDPNAAQSPVTTAARDALEGKAAFPYLLDVDWARDLSATLGKVLSLVVPRPIPIDFSLDSVAGSVEDEVKQRTLVIAQRLCRSRSTGTPSATLAKDVLPKVLHEVEVLANTLAPNFVLEHGDCERSSNPTARVRRKRQRVG